VGHFVGATLTTGGNSYALAIGDFAVVSSDLTAPIDIVPGSFFGLGNACAALPAGSLTGEIAVLARGTCSFSTKIRNAQNAGASAVVVVNNVAGAPIAMGQDGTANQPTIPAYQAGLSDRAALVAADGSSGTISAALQYVFNAAWNNFMAGFSSQGPTDVDFRVKPDVVAPGVNVLSSIPHQFCDAPPCFAFFQGTSMATPHLAGTAAVLIGAHPTWDAWQIRSAIVQNADQGVLQKSSGGPATDPNLIGSGLDDVDAALNAQLLFNPVSVSFGAVPSGSGQTLSYPVWVQNVSGTSQTFTFSVSASTGTGVAYSVTPSLTLANGAGDWIWVTMSAEKGSSTGDHNAKLRAFDGSAAEVAHAAVYTLVK
ncbi:MAG: S8 family serine peptidase, partial [Chloroflexi bacterium]|nr:S8 family serine peptidase [Chloroflexota bacterium]